MDLQTLRTEYEDVYLPSRNFAPKTRTDYAGDVAAFLRFLGEHGVADPNELSLPVFNAYLAHLDGRKLSGAYRRRATYAIKSFCTFLVEHRRIAHNPALELTPPRVEQHTPRVLTEAEYKRLKEAVAYEVRDRAIIELLLQTGLRLGELSRLQLRDVTLPAKITTDPENAGELHVRRGKGRKDRRIALNHKACGALREYLKTRPADAPTQALFLTKYNTPLSPRVVQKMLEKHLAVADIRDASPHALRHTFGTHMVKSGANLRTVQEMMGHADLKATSIYVSLAREMMNKDVQAHTL